AGDRQDRLYARPPRARAHQPRQLERGQRLPGASRRQTGAARPVLRLSHQRRAVSEMAGVPARQPAEDDHLLGPERHLLYTRGWRCLPSASPEGRDPSAGFGPLRSRGLALRDRKQDARVLPGQRGEIAYPPDWPVFLTCAALTPRCGAARILDTSTAEAGHYRPKTPRRSKGQDRKRQLGAPDGGGARSQRIEYRREPKERPCTSSPIQKSRTLPSLSRSTLAPLRWRRSKSCLMPWRRWAPRSARLGTSIIMLSSRTSDEP